MNPSRRCGCWPGDRILVGCDNNFPKLGRNPNLPDDTELIIVDLPGR